MQDEIQTVTVKAVIGFVLRGKPVEPGRTIEATIDEAADLVDEGRAIVVKGSLEQSNVSSQPKPIHREDFGLYQRDQDTEPEPTPTSTQPLEQESEND